MGKSGASSRGNSSSNKPRFPVLQDRCSVRREHLRICGSLPWVWLAGPPHREQSKSGQNRETGAQHMGTST
jgi:hypothetical protein